VTIDLDKYKLIRSGRAGFYEQKRGLIAVSGEEAVQFLDGLITNSIKGLEDGGQMLAAFPDAKGRLIAVVRVLRMGDRFLFETEAATREAVHQNLFRFTFAGDFFVEDLSDGYIYFEMFGPVEDVYHPEVGERFAGAFAFELAYGAGYFMPNDLADEFRDFLTMKEQNDCQQVDDELYETLRIETGIPKYGIDMDAMTVVPELGLDGLVSYNKGCYIGQEIIARIHFRGHVAKQLTGIMLSGTQPVGWVPTTAELMTSDNKPAGRITSATYSPKLGKMIALAYVRYDYLGDGTILSLGGEEINVTDLPFIYR
jgi:folate-binding protein YgfZ